MARCYSTDIRSGAEKRYVQCIDDSYVTVSAIKVIYECNPSKSKDGQTSPAISLSITEVVCSGFFLLKQTATGISDTSFKNVVLILNAS